MLGRILVYLALLLATGAECAVPEQAPPPSEAEPPPPAPLPPPQERILSPIPRQFDWMNREVRPNPALESLLSLQRVPPRLFMSLSLSEEVSDNFFQTQSDRQSGYQTIATIGTIYRLERGASFVSLANTLSAEYEAHSEESNFGFANLSLNVGHQLPRLSLALSESFIRSNNVEVASPTGIRRGHGTFLSNSVSPQMRYQLYPDTSLNLAYTNTLVRNENQNVSGTDTLIQSGAQGNSLSNSFTAGVQHSFTRALSGRLNYTFTTTDSTETFDSREQRASADLGYLIDINTSALFRAFGTLVDQSDGGTDSQIYGASIGMRRQLTPFLAAFISVGPTVLLREDSGPRIIPNWQVALDGPLPLTRRTSLSFSAQHSIQDTSGDIDNVGIVETWLATVTLNHTVSPNLLTSLFVNYGRTEFLQNVSTTESIQGQKDNFWSVGARATYALTRRLSLSGNYLFQRRDSNLADDSFYENRITVSLTAAFQAF